MSGDDQNIGAREHGRSLADPARVDQAQAEDFVALVRGADSRTIVPLGHRRALVKRLSPGQLRERAFLLVEPFDRLRLRSATQVFEIAGQLYELVIIDPELRPASDPDECEALFELYTHADRICMLGEFVDFDALLRGPHINKDEDRGDGHPAGPRAKLARVLAAIEPVLEPLRPANDAGLRRGFVHGDLHRRNVLVSEPGRGHATMLIDLDPIMHSYAALNLAHFCIEEYVIRPHRVARLADARARLLALLDQADAAAFDFLVLVELFRMLIKRGFHRQHYTLEWEDELLFLFEGFGVDTYLANRRAAASSR